jgi:hypothetical protein
MFCYEIVYKTTGEKNMVFGYSLKDAARRRNFNIDDVEVIDCYYEE